MAGCRCESCRAANRRYASERERFGWDQRIAERWVSPARAAAHLLELRRAGVGLRRISEQTGIARTTLAELAGRGRISAQTEARILAVQPAPHRVDGTGTRRRLQALIAVGWSGASLAARMGWSTSNLWTLLLGDGLISDRTARLVEALYGELWDQPGPSTRARNLAAVRGWVPPLAWDDIDLDEAPLDVVRGHGQQRSPEQWLEDYADTWDHHGGDLELAALRLGVTKVALVKALSRARRGVAS